MADDDADRPTLVTCIACGGRDRIVEQRNDGTYREQRCRWCTNGAMTAAQVAVYQAYLKAR